MIRRARLLAGLAMDVFGPGAAGHGSALVLDGGPRSLFHWAVSLRPGLCTGVECTVCIYNLYLMHTNYIYLNLFGLNLSTDCINCRVVYNILQLLGLNPRRNGENTPRVFHERLSFWFRVFRDLYLPFAKSSLSHGTTPSRKTLRNRPKRP